MHPCGAHEPVRPVDGIRGSLEPRLLRCDRPVGRRLFRVQNRCMVKLLEGVHVDLPVAVDRGAVVPALALFLEGVALELRHHRAEEIAQALVGLLGQVHEDEAGPDLAMHGDEPPGVLVEIEKLLLLLDEG